MHSEKPQCNYMLSTRDSFKNQSKRIERIFHVKITQKKSERERYLAILILDKIDCYNRQEDCLTKDIRHWWKDQTTKTTQQLQHVCTKPQDTETAEQTPTELSERPSYSKSGGTSRQEVKETSGKAGLDQDCESGRPHSHINPPASYRRQSPRVCTEHCPRSTGS